LFHRMANTLNYLDIKHVLTSCGTCIDQLMTYELGDIFKSKSNRLSLQSDSLNMMISCDLIVKEI
jgi:hypothetical protein